MKKLTRKIKRNVKGITLIALVITIMHPLVTAKNLPAASTTFASVHFYICKTKVLTVKNYK